MARGHREKCPYVHRLCVVHAEDEDITGEIAAILPDGKVMVELTDELSGPYESNASFRYVVTHWLDWELEPEN